MDLLGTAVVDITTLVAACHALKSVSPQDAQALLRGLMANEAGSLDGLAAKRQDLWRLAHIAIHLNAGQAALQGSGPLGNAKAAEVLAGRLRRRFRKAMIAHARATLRAKPPKGRLIAKARAAALAEIGPRGTAESEQLAHVEASAHPGHALLRQGVTKPLLDLAADWKRSAIRP